MKYPFRACALAALVAVSILSCKTKPAVITEPPPTAAETPAETPPPEPAIPAEVPAAPSPSEGKAPSLAEKASPVAEKAPSIEQKTPPVEEKAPPAAPAPVLPREKSALQAESSGFWPSVDSRRKDIQFSLLFGNKSAVKTWELAIVGAELGKEAVRSFKGNANNAPAGLSWDGRRDSGDAASEGIYVARLSIDYGEAYPPVSLESKRFVLSISPPEPALRVNPARFEPSAKGVKAPVTLEPSAKPGLARLDSWSLELLGPDGGLFRSFSGAWPASPQTWDGTSTSGAYVESGKRYTAILDVTDEFGHTATARLSIPVAALPYASERSSIIPFNSGFSPNGDRTMDTMEFEIGFGNRAAVAGWKIEISNAERGLQRTWTGDGTALPSDLVWDGLTDSGASAPDGRYTALLSIDYGKSFVSETARSPSFVLDVSAPVLAVSTSPELFSPDGDGVGDLLYFDLAAKTNLARVVDWSIDLYAPEKGLFARLDGAWPVGKVAWNGLGSSGELVESAEEYSYIARVRDEFGNIGQAKGSFPTDILVIREGDRYRITIASIVFKGFTADYLDIPPERAKQNLLTLDRLGSKLARFPDYRIELVGHAVMLNWDDPVKGEIEQREVLIPLSNARARAIADALHDRGIEIERMRTEGVGAVSPLVPDSDTINRWKNRRVEFFLDKK